MWITDLNILNVALMIRPRSAHRLRVVPVFWSKMTLGVSEVRYMVSK
jgi:hypothetical protein